MTSPIDPVEVDTDPKTIRAGETVVDLAWQVSVDNTPIVAPWQARCQVRATPTSATVLETWAATVANGVVTVPLSAADTSALTWSSAMIGVEIYDSTQIPEVVYRIVQAPITVDPELVR